MAFCPDGDVFLCDVVILPKAFSLKGVMVLFLVLFSFLPFLLLEVFNDFFLVELLPIVYRLAGSLREVVEVVFFLLNFFLKDFLPDLAVKPAVGAFQKVYTG